MSASPSPRVAPPPPPPSSEPRSSSSRPPPPPPPPNDVGSRTSSASRPPPPPPPPHSEDNRHPPRPSSGSQPPPPPPPPPEHEHKHEPKTPPTTPTCFETIGKVKFKLCKMFGIPISVHITLPLFVLLVIFASIMNRNVTLYYEFVLTVYLGPILFVTILSHQLGHAFMAKRLKLSVHQIVLWPLGGVTHLENVDPTDPSFYKKNIQISVAGLITQIPTFGYNFFMYLALNNWKVTQTADTSSVRSFFKTVFLLSSVMNALLFFYNLLLVSASS
eukprot:TRINITY_DN45196_c0_g1_i2.p1 TRINITY_DN45196_c0_g1~~TRINITY_DN45196_c0_g1_i2.p1  ORF type:complete len:274 (+),score=60.55 TRINITY_DN45196_c0_g1_i2:117-938(+)